MVRFWSLGRSGLFPVSGRGSFRAFRAAVASRGLPRPFFRLSGDRYRDWFEAGLEFDGLPGEATGETMFRCYFAVRLSPRWERKSGRWPH